MGFCAQVKHRRVERGPSRAALACTAGGAPRRRVTAGRGARRSAMDKKLFDCNDLLRRRNQRHHRGTSAPPRSDRAGVSRIARERNFPTDPRNAAHRATSRRVGRVGGVRTRRVPGPLRARMELRRASAVGDGPRAAALGQDDLADHPERHGEQRAGRLHLDQTGRPRRHPVVARRARSLPRVRPYGIVRAQSRTPPAALVAAPVVHHLGGRPLQGPGPRRGGLGRRAGDARGPSTPTGTSGPRPCWPRSCTPGRWPAPTCAPS